MKFFRYSFIVILILIIVWIGYYLATNLAAVPPFLSSALMMSLPILFAVWLVRKLDTRWTTFFVGAATWIGSQVLHIPFNNLLLNPWLEENGVTAIPGTLSLLLFGFALGLSAGVFEEIARYIVIRFWGKDVRSWRNGVMLGAGHGGGEAMIIGALGFYSFLQFVILKNGDIALLAGADRVVEIQALVDNYWSTPGYLFFLAVLERIAAIAFHIAASLLVMRAVKRRNIGWLLISITAHTIFNMIAVYGALTWGTEWAELVIAIMGLGFVGLIFWLREDEPEQRHESIEAPQIPTPLTPAIEKELTAEDLEGSHYD